MPLPLQNFIQNQTVINANWLNQVDLATRPITGLPAGNLSIAAPTSGVTLTLANVLGQSAINIPFTAQSGIPAINVTSNQVAAVVGYQVANQAPTSATFGVIVGNDTINTFIMGKSGSASSAIFSNVAGGDQAWLRVGGNIPFSIGLGAPGAAAQVSFLTTGVTFFVPTSSNGVAPPAQSTGWGSPVGGAVVASYNITDAGGANSNTNKAVAQIIAYLKLKGDFGV